MRFVIPALRKMRQGNHDLEAVLVVWRILFRKKENKTPTAYVIGLKVIQENFQNRIL